MIEWLYGIDVALFRFGNDAIANPVGDWFFPFITEIKNFYIPYAVLLMGLMVFGRKRGITTVLLLILTITVADQVSSFVIKPMVGRMRPCHVLEGVRLLIGCGGGKSFTSSHATNNFAMAVLIAHFYPKARTYLLIWAGLVAFSRVYVGVHYPSDIVGGAVLGSAIALAIIYLYEFGNKQFLILRESRKASDERT